MRVLGFSTQIKIITLTMTNYEMKSQGHISKFISFFPIWELKQISRYLLN